MKHFGLKCNLKRATSVALLAVCIFACACSDGGEADTSGTSSLTEENALTSPYDVTNNDETSPVEDTDTLTENTTTDSTDKNSATTSDDKSDTGDTFADTSAPDTSYYDTSDSAVTTDSITTSPQVEPTEKTAIPVITGKVSQAYDRVIIYGTTENNAKITYEGKNGEKFTDKARGHNFYIEVTGSGSDLITLYATADGKKDSNKVQVSVSFGGDQTNVFAGRNSRLFYRPTVSFMLGSVKANESALKYTKNRLTSVLKEVQERTGKDTKLIYLIAPNPVTIYYDEQYDYLIDATGGRRHPTAGSQFVEYMNGDGKHEDIIVPDLLKVFDQHKDEMIYFSTDTHWSELGAYYAYAEMMKHINKDFPAAKAHPLSDFDIKIVDCAGGDLVSMLHADNLREETPFLIAKFKETGDVYPVKRSDNIGYRISGINWGLYPKDSYINNPSLPTAYALSDSYGAYFLPFAGMGFSQLRLHGANNNTPIDIDEIAKYKPDYIIFTYTDRNIDSNLGMITHLWSNV